MKKQFHDVCFTINNPTTHDKYYISNAYKDGIISYVIYGNEIGEQGTQHLQGFCQFTRPTTMFKAKLYLPRAHIEERKGTVKEAIEYCKKENDFFFLGESTRQGHRTDLTEVTNLISKGYTIKQVALRCPTQYIRYNKGIEKLRNFYIGERHEPPIVNVFYGPSGSGKTRAAVSSFITQEYYKWDPQNGSWFDGYDGHTNVIFDEFRGQLPFGMMLSLLDRYTAHVQYKGGMANFIATHIVITSPVHPSEWYHLEDKEGKYTQLMRRITNITELTI